MELALGIIIGLLIAFIILLVEMRLSNNKQSITSSLGKIAKPPPQKGHIIEDKLSDEEINKLIS